MHTWDLYLLAGLFGLSGILHFVYPKPYLAITPDWVPAKQVVNLLVGFVEIALALGLLLCEDTQNLAAWGIIALLVAVFPANWKHHQKVKHRSKALYWGTLIRLPLQAVLIYWAWLYT